MSLKLLAKVTCKNETVTVLRHFYTVSFKLSVKNKTGKSQRLRDKTYKVVSLISMCTSIISMDISMDLSMDIHIHGKPVHFTSTNCVYVAVHAQGLTTSYDDVRSVNAPYGAFTLRTSYDVVRGCTTSYDHVRCPTTLYDVNGRITFTMSFWLLYSFTRLANFLVVEIDKLDLDASWFTTCCVVEMTWVNMPDAYKNLCWTVPCHTDTFGCQQSRLAMFWGWWDHTFPGLPWI